MNLKIEKILIANRGEIALRIMRTVHEMGLMSVAIYARGEENCLHVLHAHEAVCLGDGDLNETYLNIEKIIFIAKSKGVDAIHPGYGFLSENTDFALSCKDNGIVFIGPSAEVLAKMGNKIEAKKIAQIAGVNVLSSFNIDINTKISTHNFNYPVLIKAIFGGGGKGMQIVRDQAELNKKLQAASRAAKSYFGNGEVFIEDYIENARHIEVQILGDHHSNIIHLYERDCTIQRNHQKIIEEAPATCISNELRSELHQAAMRIGREVGYQNAGTVEFLVDASNRFFFLEMNPRIQVEHTVTEEITGIDIVKEQIRIAEGNPLSFKQSEVKISGHSIQARIYQEDPASDFAPSSAPISFFQFPDDQNLRVESDLKISAHTAQQFDPLLAKLIVTAPNRELAMMDMSCCLVGTYIDGPITNVNYLNAIINHPEYFKNETSTSFCLNEHKLLLNHVEHERNQVNIDSLLSAAILFNSKRESKNANSVWDSIGYWRMDKRKELSYNGQSFLINWIEIDNYFVLKFDSISSYIKIISKTETKLAVQLNDSREYFTLISLSEGKTRLGVNGFIYEVNCLDLLSNYPENNAPKSTSNNDSSDVVMSHLFGKIVSLNVKVNQEIRKGEVLMIIESMKSENAIVAPKKAKIDKITVEVGNQVTDRMPLIYLKE